MGRAKKRTRQCRNLARKRMFLTKNTLNCRQFAFSVIVTGSQPSKAFVLMDWNNINYEFSKNAFYSEMKFICDEIILYAKQSMNQAFHNLEPGTYISFDGSWEHRRNSKRCLVCVIDQRTQKVIMSEIISSKLKKDNPNYCEYSQNMEVCGLRLMIPRLKKNKNITHYVHDNDSKARKLIRDSQWDIIEKLDPRHALKSFDRKLISFQKKCNIDLSEISKSLRKFLKQLLFLNTQNTPYPLKVQYWKNSVNHFCGDHSKCPFTHKKSVEWSQKNDPIKVHLLKKFIESTQFILEFCDPFYSTQPNESLHDLKLKYATKDCQWGFTWDARMACAILDRNEINWKMNLYRKLNLPKLDDSKVKLFESSEKERIQKKNFYHSSEYFEYRKALRKQTKNH